MDKPSPVVNPPCVFKRLWESENVLDLLDQLVNNNPPSILAISTSTVCSASQNPDPDIQILDGIR